MSDSSQPARPVPGQQFTAKDGTTWVVHKVVDDALDPFNFMVRLKQVASDEPLLDGLDVPMDEWAGWSGADGYTG